MIKSNLKEIAVMCKGELPIHVDATIQITGVVTDSRHITQGCLFVPLAGERFDAHDFVAAALEAGASAVLWSKKGERPPGPAIIVEDTLVALQNMAASYLASTSAKVIGITGSNGKTTTKDMVYALLSTTYKVHKTQGNFNNHIGMPLTILSMPTESDFIVLEMGMSDRGEIKLLSELAKPEVVIITNIGESHLLQLGSRLEIARAKLEIMTGLRSEGLLVCNGDEPLIQQVLGEAETQKPHRLNKMTFGLEHHNDEYPSEMNFAQHSVSFTTHQGGSRTYTLPLLGQHNVINSLAALIVARHYKVSEEKIVQGLQALSLTGMRIEFITCENGIAILNDAYNASPTSMKAALHVLESMKGYHRKVAVLGDMLELGENEGQFHEEIGSVLDQSQIDYLFTLGELGKRIAQGAKKRLDEKKIYAYTDKAELIAKLEQTLSPQDVVLVKASRGMALEQVVEQIKQIKYQH